MLRVYGTLESDLDKINEGLVHAKESLELAEKAASLVPPESELVYDDQILFPARIYYENLKLYQTAAETMSAFADRHNDSLTAAERKDAKKRLNTWKKRMLSQLKKLRALLAEGSKWKKWDGWTHPDNFRKITPPPDVADVERIIRSLQ